MKSAEATMDPEARRSFEERILELERQLLHMRRELRPESEAVPAQPFDALEVRVDEQLYLVPVAPIREVLPAPWPTPLPEAPPWVRGTFRYGNVVVPVIDLALRLHGERRELRATDVIVLLQAPTFTGLLAHGARDVLRVAPAELAPPSPGIPQAPFLVASLARDDAPTAHLLSTLRLGRELIIDDDR